METNAFEAESTTPAGWPGDVTLANPADSGINMTLIGQHGYQKGRLAPGSWVSLPTSAGTASVKWVEQPVPRQPFLRRLRLALRMVFTGR